MDYHGICFFSNPTSFTLFPTHFVETFTSLLHPCFRGEAWLGGRCNACNIGVVTAWIVGTFDEIGGKALHIAFTAEDSSVLGTRTLNVW